MSSLRVAAIIPAAGQGVRMGSHKKQFDLLDGTPVIVHTLRKFFACPEITSISVAVPKGDLGRMMGLADQESGRHDKTVSVMEGGTRRQESVEICLRSVEPNTDLVAVHDAVRPFVTAEVISSVVQEAGRSGACIPGILSVDTVKQVERNHILGTIPRERVVLAQTPQVFRYDILKRAFAKAREDDFHGTDEASLVEHLGIEITVVKGLERNFKITTPADMELAKYYLRLEQQSF